MIEGIVKKIMFTGIEKYARNYGIKDVEVQIKVLNNPEDNVFYIICENYVEVELVTFLKIMDKKLDMFGYEALANPFLKKSLIDCANEFNLSVDDVFCYIVKYVDNVGKQNVGLAFYNTKNQKLKTISLAKHLEKLGI
jgi:hypothetical protein